MQKKTETERKSGEQQEYEKRKKINKNQIAEEVKQHYIKLTVLGKRLNHIKRDQRVINRLGAPVVFFVLTLSFLTLSPRIFVTFNEC